MILYLLGRIASLVLWRLPPRQGYALACVLGYIVYLTWPRGRTCLRENMCYVLGNGASQKQIDRLTKGSLRNYLRYLVDFVHLPAVKPEDIKRRVTFQGWDNLEGALREGKGAILVGLHQGNWDLSGAALALRNYPLNVVAESFHSAKLNDFVQRRRREKGMKVIPMEYGVGRMVQALRRNELLALLIDIPGANKGVAVMFFDAIAQVPKGAATLALKTEAKVVPVSSVRLSDNTFLTLIDQYIRFQPSGDLKKDIQALTQRIMSSLERFVSQYPDQWYMFRRMWMKENG
ncbi:MAG: lysophospholipid acyltransferase family protein [Dehalococcoidia bacterium]